MPPLVIRTLAFAASLAAAGACSAQPEGAAPPAGARPFVATTVADLDSPWAMAFLPDGRMLVTEKDGRLLIVRAGVEPGRAAAGTSPVAGVPATDSAGQGALMDVVPARDFARSGLIYLSGSVAAADGKGVVLWRARLVEAGGAARLEDVRELFRASPFVPGDGHYSGRIALAPDGRHLFFTAGDRQKFTPAQDKAATLGKVLRLTLDGRPAGDPKLRAQGFHPAVWSYGHRNLLGIAFDPAGQLWEQEMGPKGGDEVNLVLPGRNYGWPQASNGSHYDGRDIPDHAPADGFEPPKVWWNPAISPAGLMIYTGAMFPQWRGDAFIGGLSSQALLRIDIDGDAARKGDQWPMGARIREVEQAPDGAIWLLEDGTRGSQGRLIRLGTP